MFAIYAFSRAVDDIADEGDATRSERRDELDRWRAEIEAIYKGGLPDRAAFLSPVVARYGLRKDDFMAGIDGMQMEVGEDIPAPNPPPLGLFCERGAPAARPLLVQVLRLG